MHKRTTLRATIAAAALALSVGTPVISAQASEGGTSAQDVKREVAEATRAIGNYTVEQRDQAVKKAGDAVAALDARIAMLESQLDREREKMDQAARQKAIDTLNALRKQRMEIAEWYGGMKHASNKAWSHAKNGFLKSYQTLGDAFGKAAGEF